MTIGNTPPAGASATRRLRRAPQDARAAMLATARRLLLERGPAAITLKTVATDLGMAHGNVTHHFGSAAGLQIALAEQMIGDLMATVAAAVLQLRAGAYDLEGVVDLVFDAFEQGGAGQLIAWLASSEQQDRLVPLCAAVANLVPTLHDDGPEAAMQDAVIANAIVMVLLPALGSALIGETLHAALALDRRVYRKLISAQIGALKR